MLHGYFDHTGTLSFDALEDLYSWKHGFKSYPGWNGSILILQGDRDIVINRDHNLGFLQAKIKDPRIKIINGANHQLMNESTALRNEVFNLIFSELP